MLPLNSPLFWVVTIAVVLGIAVYIVIQAKRVRPRLRDFFDLVRNPELWDEFEASSRQTAQMVAKAQTWDDETVEGAVCHFLFDVPSSRDAWTERQALCSIPQRTTPTVLRLLKDHSLYPRFVRPTGKFILPEAPFNRACELLGDSPSAEVIPAIEPFATDPDHGIRRDAARTLAKTGSAAAIPLLRTSLNDSDEHVRGAVLNALFWLEKRDADGEHPFSALFDDIRGLLDDGLNARDAAGSLLRFDRRRATELFLAPDVFATDSSVLPPALRALVDQRVEVPRDRLRSLIDELLDGPQEYPGAWVLSDALTLLGQQRQLEDRKLLEDLCEQTDERIAEGAAQGLLAWEQVEDYLDQIRLMEENCGYARMPQSFRYCLAVFECDAEIANGGLAQYFVNSAGDHWRDALAGLEAMGATSQRRALQGAIELFGKAGPSTDRRRRQSQLSQLYQKRNDVFRPLEAEFDKGPIPPAARLARYVAAHADEFRRMGERLS
ncbi:DMP19 family protein [Planctellipticum variicoloris]|uniref:DMP19 family protein n=1 Tax=Planctellipticum variicoloris TaxID=3064265 RepID=UPI003013931C|nr:DUF4375 domain-containing protein [Planctomycetaceae bacterium SH412]